MVRKLLKWFLYTVFFLLLIGVLFRGPIFRKTISYKSIGQRENYNITNDSLTLLINNTIDSKQNLTIDEIIQQSLNITSHQLYFTTTKNSINPNVLISTKSAHCVGYACFFSTTCNYLLEKNNLSQAWEAIPQIGKLYIGNKSIHDHFISSFFKDHDFVMIKNRISNEIRCVDPTINDYLGIMDVTLKN